MMGVLNKTIPQNRMTRLALDSTGIAVAGLLFVYAMNVGLESRTILLGAGLGTLFGLSVLKFAYRTEPMEEVSVRYVLLTGLSFAVPFFLVTRFLDTVPDARLVPTLGVLFAFIILPTMVYDSYQAVTTEEDAADQEP